MEPDDTMAHTTEIQAERRWHRNRVFLGLAALLVLGVAGYLYSARDANKEVGSAPTRQQAERPEREDIASRPAENAPQPSAPLEQPVVPPAVQTAEAPSASSVPPAPSSSGTPSQQPTTQDTVAQQAQGPTDSAPPASVVQPAPPASMRDQATSLPNDEIVFVQKQGVNIRSEPSVTGRIVGSASKGRQFKVIRRVGSWIQIEGDTDKGWISARLIGRQKP